MGYPIVRSSGFGLFPAGSARVEAAAGQLVWRDVPERVGEGVPERAVVGEDLEVVAAVPAGAVERGEDAGDVSDALAGEDAVGEAPRRLAHVVDVDARDPVDLGGKVIFETLGVPQMPDVELDADRVRHPRLLDQLHGLRDRVHDRPLLAAVPAVGLERDPQAERARLRRDPPQTLDYVRALTGAGEQDDRTRLERGEATQPRAV